jgi:hypothetical protein
LALDAARKKGARRGPVVGVHETEALQALENGDADTAQVRAALAQVAAVNRLPSVLQHAAAPKYDLRPVPAGGRHH